MLFDSSENKEIRRLGRIVDSLIETAQKLNMRIEGLENLVEDLEEKVKKLDQNANG